MLKYLPVFTAAAMGFLFSLVIVAALSASHRAVQDARLGAQALVTEIGYYGVSQ